MTDEKILKKVGALLLKYGVTEEEKNGFIEDLKEIKEDEEAPVEEKEVEVKDEEVANDSEEVVNDENEQPTEEATAPEEVVEEEKVEETTTNEENVEEATAPETETETVEETPADEQKEDNNPVTFDYKSQYEELKKSFDGLVSRMETLESIVSKLGVDVEDKSIGASPIGTPIDEEQNDAFNVFMRKRLG